MLDSAASGPVEKKATQQDGARSHRRYDGRVSRQDVELVRRAYEAYSRGDLAAAGSAYSQDTLWDVSRFRPDVETHSGQEELSKSIGSWRETWTEHSFALEQAVDGGDCVVAVIQESGRGKASGAPVTIRYGQVIRVRGGKIVETVVYRDPKDAFDAAEADELQAGGLEDG